MSYKTACTAVKGWGLTWRSLVGLSWRFWMCWSFNLQRWSSTGNSSLQTDTCWHHQTRPGLHMQSLNTQHLKHKVKETSYVKVHSRLSYTFMNWNEAEKKKKTLLWDIIVTLGVLQWKGICSDGIRDMIDRPVNLLSSVGTIKMGKSGITTKDSTLRKQEEELKLFWPTEQQLYKQFSLKIHYHLKVWS